MVETRRRILDTARMLFDARGIHRVGVRDVARAVGLSPGNLAYHFATKDDLVAALVKELHEINARTVFAALPPQMSLVDLYRAAIGAMHNMLRYRFVLLSYVDAVLASSDLGQLEASLRPKRRARHDAMMELLCDGGWLDRRGFRARAEYLHEQGELVSSGWLAAALLRGMDDDVAVLHYAKVGCALLEPVCTDKGRRQLRRILAGECEPHGSAGVMR